MSKKLKYRMPVRFIEKEGKKLLQYQPSLTLFWVFTIYFEWQDVPLVMGE